MKSSIMATKTKEKKKHLVLACYFFVNNLIIFFSK